MSTTTSAPMAGTVAVGPVTQSRVLVSEWIKMRSPRSTVLTLLAAVVAMVALAWLIGWATNAHWSSMQITTTAATFGLAPVPMRVRKCSSRSAPNCSRP